MIIFLNLLDHLTPISHTTKNMGIEIIEGEEEVLQEKPQIGWQLEQLQK